MSATTGHVEGIETHSDQVKVGIVLEAAQEVQDALLARYSEQRSLFAKKLLFFPLDPLLRDGLDGDEHAGAAVTVEVNEAPSPAAEEVDLGEVGDVERPSRAGCDSAFYDGGLGVGSDERKRLLRFGDGLDVLRERCRRGSDLFSRRRKSGGFDHRSRRSDFI